MVDPGIDNNYSLECAIMERNYKLANELLKHPLVAVDYISGSFVMYLIGNNCLCVAERILKSNDDNIIAIFKRTYFVDIMIKSHNDITYLAIKIGIFDVSELIDFYPEQKSKIKKYLRNFSVDDIYVCKPYELNLDPYEIFKRAIKSDDIDMAKSIINYPVSIKLGQIFPHLEYCKFGSKIKSVSSYIWNEILKEYDPDELFMELLYRDYDKKCMINLFDLIDYFDLEINYKHIWENNVCFMRKNMWSNIKRSRRINECEKFVGAITGIKIGNDYRKLIDDDKMLMLDDMIEGYY
jgi:hypothetical protein